MLFYDLGPRTLRESFDGWHGGDPGEGGDDWRRYVKGKVWRTVCSVSELDYGWQKCCRSFTTELMDHLLARVQHMDEQGHAIMDVCYDRTNPIKTAHESFRQMVGLPVCDGSLKVIFDHFKDDLDKISSITSECRRLAVSMDAQVEHTIE